MTVISKGGENIPDNTYGFEIEFCSHDNSVFAFTHVDTAEIQVFFGDDSAERWSIETDSGNVLELVSPPLKFPEIGQAYYFKEILANALRESVREPLIYEEWFNSNRERFTEIFAMYYGPCELRFVYAGFDHVQPQINVENVDDGINIQAAKLRLFRNMYSWVEYVGATVVARSEKDWLQGYSSQVNLPMTAVGYFLYSVHRKLPSSQKRFAVMVEQPDDLLEVPVDKLERHLSTWFWRNVQFSVFAWYAGQIYGNDVLGAIHGLLPPDEDRARFISELPHLRVRESDLKISRAAYDEVTNIMPAVYAAPRTECSAEDLKRLAVLYITVGKMLCGALGSLSERNQLHLQNIAWLVGSTEGMAPPVLETDEIMAQRRWLEYHSSMKDLTGLWFKGALLDVLAKEQVAIALPAEGLNVWFAVIGTYVSILNAERWDTGRIYPGELEELHFQELCLRISEIQNQYNIYINDFGEAIPKFELPSPKERPFLHYGRWPNAFWEGRYDTMIEIDKPNPAVGWTYLIEHRFN